MLEASSMCMPRDVSTWRSPLLYKSSLRNGINFCGTENIISLASAVSRRIVGGGRFCLSARCEYICQLNHRLAWRERQSLYSAVRRVQLSRSVNSDLSASPNFPAILPDLRLVSGQLLSTCSGS